MDTVWDIQFLVDLVVGGCCGAVAGYVETLLKLDLAVLLLLLLAKQDKDKT